MNARRTLAMVGALVFAATPLASYAGPRQALDACVKSFVETYIPKDRAVRVHRQQPPVTPLSIERSERYIHRCFVSAGGTQR